MLKHWYKDTADTLICPDVWLISSVFWVYRRPETDPFRQAPADGVAADLQVLDRKSVV